MAIGFAYCVLMGNRIILCDGFVDATVKTPHSGTLACLQKSVAMTTGRPVALWQLIILVRHVSQIDSSL